MTPGLEVIQASEEHKTVLRNLLQLYVHDLSEFEGFETDPHGMFWYRWLDHYWTEDTRHPFRARAGDQWAGFALVNEEVRHSDARYSMAEFFILRRYRGQGLGLQVAKQVMQQFPGRWEIRQAPSNTAATTLWRRVAASLADHVDEPDADRPVQVFDVAG